MQPIKIRFIDTVELTDLDIEFYKGIVKINECFTSAHHLAQGKDYWYEFAMQNMPSYDADVKMLLAEDLAQQGIKTESIEFVFLEQAMGTTKFPNSGDSFGYRVNIEFKSVVYTCVHISPPDCYICYTEDERELKYISTGYKVIVEPH